MSEREPQGGGLCSCGRRQRVQRGKPVEDPGTEAGPGGPAACNLHLMPRARAGTVASTHRSLVETTRNGLRHILHSKKTKVKAMETLASWFLSKAELSVQAKISLNEKEFCIHVSVSPFPPKWSNRLLFPSHRKGESHLWSETARNETNSILLKEIYYLLKLSGEIQKLLENATSGEWQQSEKEKMN